jgi:16S rRNA (cytidine1402-2'-O)-methyltransferase
LSASLNLFTSIIPTISKPNNKNSVCASAPSVAQSARLMLSTRETPMTEPAALASALYVIATPIGNLADISARALHVLRSVDELLCEDTRTTQTLLRHYAIQVKLVSYHDHNEQARTQYVIDRLKSGACIGLVSDAGTPLISDPGYVLVRALRQAGHTAISIPGPSALTSALSISGLPTQRFCFEGFLPAASGARRAALQALSHEPRTLVFYESTHRLSEFLADAIAIFGPAREASIAKELSKAFERCEYGTLIELQARFTGDLLRGEFVVMIAGNPEPPALAEAKRICAILARDVGPSQAAKLAAKLTGVARRDLYASAQEAE